MGKLTILEQLKEWIGGKAWRVFLWSIDMTDFQFNVAKYDEAILLGDPRKTAENPNPYLDGDNK